MMEISIAMIILSRVLKPGVNRWVNMIASIITIVICGRWRSIPSSLPVRSTVK